VFGVPADFVAQFFNQLAGRFSTFDSATTFKLQPYGDIGPSFSGQSRLGVEAISMFGTPLVFHLVCSPFFIFVGIGQQLRGQWYRGHIIPPLPSS
jgi:hypothetical protein